MVLGVGFVLPEVLHHPLWFLAVTFSFPSFSIFKYVAIVIPGKILLAWYGMLSTEDFSS